MTLHLIKLCVGADSVEDLQSWIDERMAMKKKRGEKAEHKHITRMVPKRVDALLDGGSLYWVIKGQIAARQGLAAIRPFIDGDGIGRCELVLEPVARPVLPRPCRPFQGWRYFDVKDAPPDLTPRLGDVAHMPETMRRELSELGLI
ncbi:MAG TPA: DUF1489 domain-containing protein [Roseiarcus sp.]|nr:DUF1489 domain-containing protein [Roseiarcus sp.]